MVFLNSHWACCLSIGVFVASQDLKTEWIVIKGISRYADCNDGSDAWFVFANAMAASVVNNILSEPYVFEEWPHYNDIRDNTCKGTIMIHQGFNSLSKNSVPSSSL